MSADIVTQAVRSRMMAGIKDKNTKPELVVRSELHRMGFRFRLHRKDLPGKPDLVFPKYNAVLFVHGCFWHGHDCHLFKWPKTRTEFWHQKIVGNRTRDQRQLMELQSKGWRTGIIWECAIKGKYKLPIDSVSDRCSAWLLSNNDKLRLSCNETRTTG